MNMGQDRNLQIAKQIFLVILNGIKMRCSNTAFYIYLRKVSQNWGNFSSSALLLDTLGGITELFRPGFSKTLVLV